MPDAPEQPPAEAPPRPPMAADPAEMTALAKSLLRSVRAGALATLDRATGHPFASLVTVATAPDGAPLLLLSRLSAHTLNLEAEPRASILLAQTGKGDPLAHPRLTVVGRAARSDDPEAAARFLARHPKAELYAGFADFSFWRLEVEAGHLNGGFARAMSLTADQLLTPLDGAAALVAAERGAVEHMNEDHRDAILLYATRLAGAPEAEWRLSGLDPEGMDLAAGDRTARVAFPERVTNAGELRRLLVRMVGEIRSAG